MAHAPSLNRLPRSATWDFGLTRTTRTFKHQTSQFWQYILQFHGVFIIVPVSIPMHRVTFWTSIIPTKLRISKMGSTCVSSTQHFNTLPILQILQKSIYDTKINIKQWCSCQGIMITSDIRILTQRCPHFFASSSAALPKFGSSPGSSLKLSMCLYNF